MRSIQEGVPGTSMPAWGKVLEAEQQVERRARLRDRRRSPGQAAKELKPHKVPDTNPVAISAASVGPRRSRFSCSAAPAATAARPTARDRTRSISCRARAICATAASSQSVNDQRMFDSILYGVQGTAMPAWIDYGLTQERCRRSCQLHSQPESETQGASMQAGRTMRQAPAVACAAACTPIPRRSGS